MRRSVKAAPPIDWMWAAILERKTVLGYDLKEMAKLANVPYDTMRRYIRMNPAEWKRSAREKVLKGFGIKVQTSITQEGVTE
jgi:hypothetical protein